MKVLRINRNIVALAIGSAVALGSGALVASAPAAATDQGYSQVSLSVTVDGTSVVAQTMVTSASTSSADHYGVCARSSTGGNVDFAKPPAVITPDGTPYQSPAKTFAPGTYTYFSCVHAADGWHNVGPAKSFTVGSTTASFTETALSATVQGSRVTAHTTVQATDDLVAEYFMVCAHDSEGRSVDFPGSVDAPITTTGSDWSGHRDYPDGTYTYFACVQAPDGSWWNSPDTKTFTVGGPAPSPTTSTPSPSPSTTVTADPSPSTSTGFQSQVTKVLTIVEENHSLGEMSSAMPYLYGLAQRFAYADHYTALVHPSLPNYLAIAGGSTFGVTDDAEPSAHPLSGESVFGQALARGLTSGTYAESMPANCVTHGNSDKGYAVKHNPQAYFTDERANCAATDVPETTFLSDARNDRLPNVGMLVPNKCNDAHDVDLGCDLSDADAWLSARLPTVLASSDFTSGRLAVVVTADEDDTAGDNTVLTVVLHQSLDGSHKVVTTPLNHYSLSRLYSEVVGAPALRRAANAPDMAAAFGLPLAP